MARYSSPNFQMTVKSEAWIPLVASRTPRPRPKSPAQPSCRSTCCTASAYVIETSDVCRVVLITRIELEVQSETHVAQKPVTACRRSLGTSPASGSGAALAGAAANGR